MARHRLELVKLKKDCPKCFHNKAFTNLKTLRTYCSKCGKTHERKVEDEVKSD